MSGYKRILRREVDRARKAAIKARLVELKAAIILAEHERAERLLRRRTALEGVPF